MRHLIVTFIVAAFVMLTASRIALALWQRQRMRAAGGLRPILIGGLRIDANQIAILAVLPAFLSPWVGHSSTAVAIASIWFQTTWLLLVFMEVATPPFIMEYDTRPNRLFVEYLKHPREVSGMLWRGYKIIILAGVLAVAAALWIGHALFGHATPDAVMPFWLMPIVSLGVAAIAVAAIRGTMAHRPINPSNVAYCGDGMLNTLPLNSTYSVLYSIYLMRYERSASAVYGNMPEAEMHEIVRAHAALPGTAPDPQFPTRQARPATATPTRPLNLVIILEESLGAQYSAALGGRNLTPELDSLSEQGWAFTRTYATGTRSVRGLEAVTAGFPPTPAKAVVKLPGAQRGFFTLADLLARHGYESSFIYGGEAHFDNMKGFFLGNGFDRIIDRSAFVDPQFVGTWGACDEDMFNQLDQLLSTESSKPTFTLAFSVSNHSPWEYPSGRIEPDGNPARVENTVRYADWALGRFFERAKSSAYWENTVFLVVADHDSRVSGATLVPVRHFHIPAVILGAGVTPKRDDRLISQLDLAPTLLSLIGITTAHPMIGHDLTRTSPERAIMQFGDCFGYLRDDALLVMTPGKPPAQYCYRAPEEYIPAALDPNLARIALAHALWPSWAYREGRYTLADKPITQRS
jgi:phosphoglycerol transferase MdoB-like AlkP superfamily enzyme